ncbi:hypothetical protein [Paraburkholderia sp. UCT2]|uniref:hypothetical protein n=1 Tax=Paraburkholderia sp. UCT2 TaxID=2615208 RepID=UPI001655A83F|nr:hypothetical protein [Paraburkholderia sp. UCT2]
MRVVPVAAIKRFVFSPSHRSRLHRSSYRFTEISVTSQTFVASVEVSTYTVTNTLERSGRDCLLEVRDDGRGENARRFSSQTTESGRDARFTILWLINQHATGRYHSRTLASDEPVPLTESGEKIWPLIDAGAVVNLLKFAQQIDNARIVGIDVGCIQRLQ